MSSRLFMISACCVALIAGPAFPQSLSTLTPTQSTASSQAVNPANMRAALRAWGLDRPNPNLRYTKRTITSDRAEFENVVISSGPSGSLTLENLVITRTANAGASSGQFNVLATDALSTSGPTIGSITLTGVRGNADLGTFLLSLGDTTTLAQITPTQTTTPALQTNMIAERLTMTDLSSGNRAGKMAITIKEIALVNPSIANGLNGADSISVKDIVAEDDAAKIKIASVGVTEVGAPITAFLNPKANGLASPFDLMTLTLGGFSLDDLTMTYKKAGPAAVLNSLSLANIRVGAISKGYMDRFGFSGLKLEGVAARQPWQMSLASVSATGINLGYVGEATRYMQATIGAALRRSPTSNATTATTNPNAQVPASGPRRTLSELLPGGPLDGGFTGFDLADFSGSVAGFDVTLDKIEFKQQRNGTGIVTRADLLTSQLRISWANMRPPESGPMSAFFRQLGGTDITARISMLTSFVPETDLLTLESYTFDLVDWGSVNLGIKVSGLTSFMAKTSFTDIINMTSAPTPSGAASTRAAIADMLKIYSGVAINSAQLDGIDRGGIEKAARLSSVMSRRAASGAPIAPSLSGDQIRDIRNLWAQKPRNFSGDKTKPGIERQMSLAYARWLESGGKMTFSMNPPTPLGVSIFDSNTAPSLETLGFRVTNQAPR